MERIKLGDGRGPLVSRVACGLWRLHTLELSKAEQYIANALERDITYFDTAAVYGKGASEMQLGQILKNTPSLRDKMVIQTKCGNLITAEGMRYYDFSKDEILKSVDDSLRRMQTDYVDLLLLHRPDALAEPEQIAEAFEQLQRSGKVRWFGVSNQNPMQIELLQSFLKEPILINQLQFGLAHAQMAVRNLYMNTEGFTSFNYDDGVMDYCRLRKISIQAWSPMQFGDSAGTFLNNPDFPVLNKVLREYGEKYTVSPAAISIAWILRYPANIIPILGTLNIHHLDDLLQALEVRLERVDWYALLTAAGYKVR